jgi:hypothetical protein
MARFERGDHLRVLRWGVYWHHGVYVSDNRVIEFGGGIKDKSQAAIRPVSLDQFERHGRDTAEVVRHPRPFMLGLGDGGPEALPADEIVARAEWLIDMCTPGRYNLVGSNCEHLASWSVTNYFESLQIRRYIAAEVLMSLAFLKVRYKLSAPVQFAIAGAFFVLPTMYWLMPYRRWRDILLQWPGDDRAE